MTGLGSCDCPEQAGLHKDLATMKCRPGCKVKRAKGGPGPAIGAPDDGFAWWDPDNASTFFRSLGAANPRNPLRAEMRD